MGYLVLVLNMNKVYYGGDEYTMLEIPFNVLPADNPTNEPEQHRCMLIAPQGFLREALAEISNQVKNFGLGEELI